MNPNTSMPAPSMGRRDRVGAGTAPQPTAHQLSLPPLVALHLIPGALVTVAYVAFAPVITGLGFPPIAALLSFLSPVPLDHVKGYSARAWAVTLGAFLVVNGLVGPIVEELYFRGYLLPRMDRLGRWAPLVNVSLFSLYHFWSPWQVAARILGIGPMVFAVHWKRNVYLGMVIHCTLNLIGVLLVARQVQGRL